MIPTALIALGLAIQTYGLIKSQIVAIIIGTVLYLIGLGAGSELENELRNRIENLERELEELKAND